MRFWHAFHDAAVVGARAAERGTWGPHEVGVLAIALVEAEEALKADEVAAARKDERAQRIMKWAEQQTPEEFGRWAKRHMMGRPMSRRTQAEALAEELLGDEVVEKEGEAESIAEEMAEAIEAPGSVVKEWWEMLPMVNS